MDPLTIARMGAWDPRYPRHRVVDAGAAAAGLRIVGRPAARRGARRLADVLRGPLPPQVRAVLVPEFCHKDVAAAAWRAARAGVPLLFDPLVGRVETRVVDRGDASPRSVDAAVTRVVDRVTLSLPDLVVADTAEHADYLATLARPGQRFAVVPVGYDERHFDPSRASGGADGARAVRPSGTHGTAAPTGERGAPPPDPHPGVGVRVLFYGSFVPLHGADVIVAAAARLRGRRDIRFELVGGGQTLERARAVARAESLENVRFSPRVPFEALPSRIAAAHVCLGIFGAGEKARRVVPNKVYQCMGMARAVVTGDTPAVRGAFRDGVDVVLVRPGDPDALAEAVAWLADDARAREAIARAGHAAVRARFTSVHVARAMRAAVEAAIDGRAPGTGARGGRAR